MKMARFLIILFLMESALVRSEPPTNSHLFSTQNGDLATTYDPPDFPPGPFPTYAAPSKSGNGNFGGIYPDNDQRPGTSSSPLGNEGTSSNGFGNRNGKKPELSFGISGNGNGNPNGNTPKPTYGVPGQNGNGNGGRPGTTYGLPRNGNGNGNGGIAGYTYSSFGNGNGNGNGGRSGSTYSPPENRNGNGGRPVYVPSRNGNGNSNGGRSGSTRGPANGNGNGATGLTSGTIYEVRPSSQSGGRPRATYLPPSNENGYSNGNGAYVGDEEASTEPAKYEFQYEVSDDQYGTYFGHQESRDGDVARGEYNVVLPDGRKQVVQYEADSDGYKPAVNYEETNGGSYPSGGSNGNDEYPSGHQNGNVTHGNGNGNANGGYPNRNGNGSYQNGNGNGRHHNIGRYSY